MRFNFNHNVLALRFLGGIFVDILLLAPPTSSIHLESTARAASLVSSHPQTKISATEISATKISAPTRFVPTRSPEISVKETPAVHTLQANAYPSAHIRVQIARSASQLAIAASTNAVIRDRNHEPIARLEPNQAYSVLGDSKDAGRLQVGTTELPNELWIDSGAGAVWIEGRWYEGQVQLINTGSELLAVNRIDIERYLYSVVGAEMYASWHPQALKAQAVAARSYAMKFLESPTSAWFDIGNDEAFQVYKGLESVASSTIQAVEETHGQVLVRGNYILLAEYAATEALTQSAHRGQGMSQDGAQARAELGWSYLEILGDYYRNAAIALLFDS